MTETEWMAEEWERGEDPSAMVQFLVTRSIVTQRKLRLFACACCRRIWQTLTDERSQKAVVVAETFVDARTNPERRVLRIARRAAMEAEEACNRDCSSRAARLVLARSAFAAAQGASIAAARVIAESIEILFYEERTAQAQLLRDICGNPFRPIRLDWSWLAWNDGAVKKLAQVIYGDRAFDRLPLLADALEDAGCMDAAILAHCRAPGEHVRGCWVVDLLLGKS